MREIEVKILEINPEEIRKKLEDLGAEKVFDGELDTILFDFPDKRLGKNDSHFRVRKVGDKVEICFKGKNESSQFKTKEEIEVNTSDFKDTVKIFEKLGFIRVYEGKRRRESYKLKEISFEIDYYSTMPAWLEVEAPTEEKIVEYVAKLGFTMDQTTNLNARDLEKMYAEKKMTEEQLALVDKNDREIGQASKSEVTEKNLLHRGTDILVFNSRGEIFVHQRTFNKLLYPGHYDVCAGGGVNPRESYEDNAKRELEEELGIKNTPLEFLFKFRLSDPNNPAFAAVFKCIHDGPIKIEKKEIIHGKFMSVEEIKELMKTEKFTPESIEVFNRYLEEYHDH